LRQAFKWAYRFDMAAADAARFYAHAKGALAGLTLTRISFAPGAVTRISNGENTMDLEFSSVFNILRRHSQIAVSEVFRPCLEASHARISLKVAVLSHWRFNSSFAAALSFVSRGLLFP
jgi:hypothetical protein